MDFFAKKSFRLKLIISYLFIVVFSLGVIAFFVDRNIEKNTLNDIQASLITEANLIESQIPPASLKNEDSVFLENLVNVLRPKTKCRITIITPKGKVLADSEKTLAEIPEMENHASRPEVIAAFNGKTGVSARYSATLKINMLYAALPIKNNGGVVGVVRLALPLERLRLILSSIREIIFFGMAISLFLAFILGLVISRKIANPINKMIAVSRKFAEGDLSRRIFQPTKDELGELAATLNRMAGDIESKIKEIKKQNQRLAATFNSMVEGVIVIDNYANIVSLNSAIEKIFGVEAAEASGRHFLEVIRNNDIFEIIKQVLKKGEFASAEANLLFPVNKTFRVNVTPVFEKEAVEGCLVVIHDISEMRKLETMRRDFVANVSHELKTPLTSIKGFIETLLDGAMDDKENNLKFLKIIREQTARLENLVDDLLSLSHLESKKIILEKQKINAGHLLQEVILGFQAKLREKNVKILNELPAGLLVSADRGKLAQVFTNLIDNAIKFNKPDGFIKVYSRTDGGNIQITIEDSGIGIPLKDVQRIFERFYRVDKARSREMGGTGLGLSIVKHIIELHEGSVGVDSTEGFGSKFWFNLPA